jgi:hypothetical protein
MSMSFSGDLGQMSIVDIVQLMHASRKTGTLSIRGRRGECQLVFQDGFIVSANHCDDSIRIGQILVESGSITAEALSQTLEEQAELGPGGHKPILAMLIETNRIDRAKAYRGLETLIHLTIAEILTWRRGTFDLDMGTLDLSDEYRYFPETLHQEVHFHTEGALMDALRIYDEKKRDGSLWDEELSDEKTTPPPLATAAPDSAISADLLGLDNLENLERRIPDVYLGLDDHAADHPLRRKAAPEAPGMSAGDLAEIERFLNDLPARSGSAEEAALAVVFLSADPFMTHCLTTVCNREGFLVFASNEEEDLDLILDQFMLKQRLPVVVLDGPDPGNPAFAPDKVAGLRLRLGQNYPYLCLMQLSPPRSAPGPLLSARETPVPVLTRPHRGDGSSAADLVGFLTAFPNHVRHLVRHQASWVAMRLRRNLSELGEARDIPGMALVLLRAIAQTFPRALTLVVRNGELVPEKGVGMVQGHDHDPALVNGPRLPIAPGSTCDDVVQAGNCFLGASDDPALRDLLWPKIGAPRSPVVLLMPLQAQGKTVSVTYADFGSRDPVDLLLEPFEILSRQAEVMLENVLHRRRQDPSPA